jgi:hypothetical protein
MANRFEKYFGRTKVTVHHDGWVWVNGSSTGIKQWDSNPKKWSNSGGQEIKELSGMSLEEVLKFKGYI